MGLCEENYLLLRRLAPGVRHGVGRFLSHGPGGVDLHLEIEEQSPYTTQLRLTYLFDANEGCGRRADPDARLRVYHDARQVEVMDLQHSVLPLCNAYQHPALADKWQRSLFLARWLMFCLRQGHRFGAVVGVAARSDADSLNSTCLVRS